MTIARVIRDVTALGLLALLTTACATTASQTAQPVLTEDRSDDIVIASDGEGLGASWASVTESPLARTATELSNLGGTPVVLGAVGVIMVADAAPRGRAKRLSTALNAGIDPDRLDRDLADRIASKLDAAADPEPEIAVEGEPDLAKYDPAVRIKRFDRARDLINEGYIVDTEYAVARDGSALRVEADVTHAHRLRLEQEIRREYKRLVNSSGSLGPPPSTRDLRKLQREWRNLPPYYRGRIVYHSDTLDLTNMTITETASPDVQEAVRSALETEREARILKAEADFQLAMEQAETPRREAKAERKRQKALQKAEDLYQEGLLKAEDDEFTKMERMLLTLEAWQAETGDDATVLAQALDDAHSFIAEAVSAALLDSPLDTGGDDQRPMEFDGATLLRQEADGRLVMAITEGPDEGMVISLPETGEAEYGEAIARP